MKKASFNKNHADFEQKIHWYGKFLDKRLFNLEQREQYELLEAFVLRIAARWEVLIIQDIVTSLNHDASTYANKIGLCLRKHLTKDESEAIFIGHKFVDFKSVGDIKGFGKKYLSYKYNPFKKINSTIARNIDQFFTIRNYLAHYSSYARQKYKYMMIKNYNLKRICEPGVFLSKINKRTKKYHWVEFIETFLKCSHIMKGA
jgi:hypothetical protein